MNLWLSMLIYLQNKEKEFKSFRIEKTEVTALTNSQQTMLTTVGKEKKLTLKMLGRNGLLILRMPKLKVNLKERFSP